MPTYQYECDHCQHSFEELQSMRDEKLKQCPVCGEFSLHRLIGTGAGLIFKGTGFYETDYKRNAKVSSSTSTENSESAAPVATAPVSAEKASSKAETKDS
jgi:putative FmdB family regulatory protein